MRSSTAISFHDRPIRRNAAICSGSTSTRGRPSGRPCFFTRSSPIITRINDLSSSATAAMIVNTVSAHRARSVNRLVQRNKIDARLENSSIASTRCFTLRANRSKRATRITSNFPRLASFINRSSGSFSEGTWLPLNLLQGGVRERRTKQSE